MRRASLFRCRPARSCRRAGTAAVGSASAYCRSSCRPVARAPSRQGVAGRHPGRERHRRADHRRSAGEAADGSRRPNGAGAPSACRTPAGTTGGGAARCAGHRCRSREGLRPAGTPWPTGRGSWWPTPTGSATAGKRGPAAAANRFSAGSTTSVTCTGSCLSSGPRTGSIPPRVRGGDVQRCDARLPGRATGRTIWQASGPSPVRCRPHAPVRRRSASSRCTGAPTATSLRPAESARGAPRAPAGRHHPPVPGRRRLPRGPRRPHRPPVEQQSWNRPHGHRRRGRRRRAPVAGLPPARAGRPRHRTRRTVHPAGRHHLPVEHLRSATNRKAV